MTLLDRYDALLLDLDGTVYRGGAAVPGAAAAVTAAHERQVAVRFVTNNASRAPGAVAAHLRDLGITAADDEVSTSAQAAAAVAAERVDAGATVLVVGTDALADELRQVGLVPVREADDDVRAVVQGLAQNTNWRDLSEACLAIKAGAVWVACNADATLPTERGEVLGNGSMVAAVRSATGVEPIVAGKPQRPLLDQAVASATSSSPLVVGDRIDTDIDGARAAGLDALLVLTGVSTAADLLAMPAEHRPRYVAADLRAVTADPDSLTLTEQDDWSIADGAASWAGGDADPDPLGLLRALCAAHPGGPLTITAGDDTAAQVMRGLGLSAR